MDSSPSFAEFMQRLRGGDARAAEELVRRYESAIRRAVRFRLGNAGVRLFPGRFARVEVLLGDELVVVQTGRAIVVELGALRIGLGPVQVGDRCLHGGIRRYGVGLSRLQRCFHRIDVGRGLYVLQLRQQLAAGKPGPEGSAAKLVFARLNQEISGFEVELAGGDGLRYDDWTMRRPEHTNFYGRGPGYRYLRARGNSIEGGTSETLRHIVAERVLGLPAEPRVDKDVPWKDLPR